MSHAETQNAHRAALGLNVLEKQENKSFEESCQVVVRPEWGSSHGSALEEDLIPC